MMFSANRNGYCLKFWKGRDQENCSRTFDSEFFHKEIEISCHKERKNYH